MNRTVKLLILSSAILAMPAFAKSAYTRDDAVRIALENSPDIKSAEQDLASAESQVTSAYGSALPTVDLSATYTRTFGVGDVKKNSAISDMLDDAATKNEEMLAGVFDNYNYAMAKMGGYRWGTQIGITAT